MPGRRAPVEVDSVSSAGAEVVQALEDLGVAAQQADHEQVRTATAAPRATTTAVTTSASGLAVMAEAARGGHGAPSSGEAPGRAAA